MDFTESPCFEQAVAHHCPLCTDLPPCKFVTQWVEVLEGYWEADWSRLTESEEASREMAQKLPQILDKHRAMGGQGDPNHWCELCKFLDDKKDLSEEALFARIRQNWLSDLSPHDVPENRRKRP